LLLLSHPEVAARENLLFFSAAKRKVAKESAAPRPNAPLDKGLALRCYRTALVNWVALVFCRSPTTIELSKRSSFLYLLGSFSRFPGKKRRHYVLSFGYCYRFDRFSFFACHAGSISAAMNIHSRWSLRGATCLACAFAATKQSHDMCALLEFVILGAKHLYVRRCSRESTFFFCSKKESSKEKCRPLSKRSAGQGVSSTLLSHRYGQLGDAGFMPISYCYLALAHCKPFSYY
jgi:hypothetical protein